MEIHNFPMPVGPRISPAPLFACLTHGAGGVLASSCSGHVLWECWAQILTPSFPGCLQWFANLTSGCSCCGIWSCRSEWNQELGAASAKAFVFSFSPQPPAVSCAVFQAVCAGCGMEQEEGALLQVLCWTSRQCNCEWKGRLVIAPPCLCVLGAGEIGKRRQSWCGAVLNQQIPSFPSHCSHYSQLSLSANLHVIKNVGWGHKELYKVMLKDIPLCAFDATSGMRL